MIYEHVRNPSRIHGIMALETVQESPRNVSYRLVRVAEGGRSIELTWRGGGRWKIG